MKTAIDWLVSELPTIDWEDPYYKAKLEEAKAMEKEVIMDAVTQGWDYNEEGLVRGLGEKYYNEKFE